MAERLTAMPGITIYLDDEMIDALDLTARLSGRTRSGAVRWILEHALIEETELDAPRVVSRTTACAPARID